MITLYHSSNVEVSTPDLKHSRPHLDFGKGFYLTTMKDQAEKYAQRFIRRHGKAVINTYDLEEDWEHYTHKIFEAYNGEWLDFVTLCRKSLPHKKYDCIEGGIADDSVFDTCDLYFSGKITRDEALDRLRFEKPNHQMCITSQELLSKLKFVESIEIR